MTTLTKPAGTAPAKPPFLYDCALTPFERTMEERARQAKGLDNEIALLRLRILTVATEQPDNVELLLKAVSRLFTALIIRFRIYNEPDDVPEIEAALMRIGRSLGLRFPGDEESPTAEGVSVPSVAVPAGRITPPGVPLAISRPGSGPPHPSDIPDPVPVTPASPGDPPVEAHHDAPSLSVPSSPVGATPCGCPATLSTTATVSAMHSSPVIGGGDVHRVGATRTSPSSPTSSPVGAGPRAYPPLPRHPEPGGAPRKPPVSKDVWPSPSSFIRTPDCVPSPSLTRIHRIARGHSSMFPRSPPS